MSDLDLVITELADHGDDRGVSYAMPSGWLAEGFTTWDAHVATIRPGRVRGNHYHVARREVLMVLYDDCWSLYWDRGPSTAVRTRTFTGSGCVMLEISPTIAHALRNDGQRLLRVTGLSDGVYDPAAPDAFARMVVEA